MPHDHEHNHAGGCCQQEDDEHIKPEEGQQDSLFPYIDRDNVMALNEATPDTGKLVIKPWDKRQDVSEFVESDEDDPELLLRVPFTSQVKLRSITILGEGGDQAPKNVKIYINQPQLDFSDVHDDARQPVQTLELVQSGREPAEYHVRPAKFHNIQHLTLFFDSNYGDGESSTKLFYLGFKGESSGQMVRSVQGIVYEAQANPADHAKVSQKAAGLSRRMGM